MHPGSVRRTGRRSGRPLLPLLLVGLTAATVGTPAQAQLAPSATDPRPAPTATATATAAAGYEVLELIVQRHPGQSTKAARVWLSERVALVDVDARLLGGGFERIGLAEALPVEVADALADALVQTGLVASAEADRPRSSAATPNDPWYPDQWYLYPPGPSTVGIDLPSAWSHTRGSNDVVVAVVDTGRLDHPDIASRYVDGYDFVSRGDLARDGDGWDEDEADNGDWDGTEALTCRSGSSSGSRVATTPARSSSWHGLGVAGVIGAIEDNGVGIAGVAPNARIQHIRVMAACGGVSSDLGAAIRWAAGLPVPGVRSNPTPAKVINLSLGGLGDCTSVEQQAINAAVGAGSIVIAAAGNDNVDLDSDNVSPAECANVLTVAAIGSDGRRSFYSNYGSAVDIAAPGAPPGMVTLSNPGLTSPTGDWTYGYKSGTSFSAPLVSGVAALLLSVDPTLTPADIESTLESSAQPFPQVSSDACSSDPSATYHCGAGILDAGAAVRQAVERVRARQASVERLGGEGDRFATNLAVEAVADRTDVILVSGSVYPDGLAAAALAKQENAEIVLVPADGLTSAQIDAIVAEAPETVWIVGGPNAVPTAVETVLSTDRSLGGAGVAAERIERVYGATRFDTAIEVAKRIDTIAYLAAKPTAFVVRGDSFADAVIAGPAAFGIVDGVGSHPILLVNRDTIPVGVVEMLQARQITNVVVVGGTAVVSEAVRLGIESLGITTQRIAGADRYGTSVALGQLLTTPVEIGGFGWSAADVALVDISEPSQGFDAISAVGVLGPNRRILLGVHPSWLPGATGNYLAVLTERTSRFTVVGSTRSVPDGVVAEARRRLGR